MIPSHSSLQISGPSVALSLAPPLSFLHLIHTFRKNSKRSDSCRHIQEKTSFTHTTMSHKRKADLPVGDANDLMEVTPLGAGSEVGRSCHVLKYKGKTVLVYIHLTWLAAAAAAATTACTTSAELKKESNKVALFADLLVFLCHFFFSSVLWCLCSIAIAGLWHSSWSKRYLRASLL